MDKSDVDTVQLNVNDLQQDNEDEIDSCGAGDGALDTKRSFSQLDSLSDQDGGFNDTGDFAEDGFDGKESDSDRKDDPIFNEIRDSIARCHSSAKSHTSSSDGAEGSPHVKVANKFVSLPYGLVPWASYEHGKRSGDIMGVTYNGRMRQFIILDSKGITSWKRDAVEHRVCRDLHYPKYEYRLITNVIYAKKHNCYFVLGKDFSLKVYNRDFYETCSVSADLRSVLFMLFNPLRDELITGGVGGTKVWRFHQQSGITPTMLRPLANYGLTLKYELPSVGGSWVKRVELDHHLEHLYCCSDTDLHVYDLSGKLLFKFERAHMMSITGCRYSQAASVLVTSSIDCEVKVWSLMGGLIHTFRGHSRAVTNLLLHPATSSIVLTCSLDGTVRMWSLDTMDCIYSLVVSADGLLWMGLTDDNMLFISTARAVTLWHMNYTVQFWALARSRVTHMELCGCKEKTTRLMAISEDSSVRLMARSNRKNLCTVLPPPSISPLQRVLSVCYSREFNTIYMLINPHEIWVYTTRTDPACRIAVWDVVDVQASFSATKNYATSSEDFNPSSISVNKPAPSHRATESGAGVEPVANCCCLAILNSTAIVWTDEGCCCPIRDSYLLLGLEDGRILFMDPVRKGHKYLEFKTGKDPVLDMYHDTTHQALVTVYKLPGMMQIHVWGLPDLELQHEVYTCPDLRGHARLGYLLVTAHESGSVMFHSMELATDPGLHKPKMVPVLEEVVDVNHKPQHQAPVIALDVCTALRIFCSCSKDGAIKIWTEDEALLTEIMLDDSLTSACFLNNMGDIVVGFQKQVFFIDHSKVCSQLTIPESDVDTFDKESFICEDPAVMYEGVSPNPDPVTLNNYLVPFDIEFSKDFLEGRVKLEPEVAKEEESDDESAHSQAPTEIYLSPAPTPRRRLSLVDLTLGSGVTQHELLNHMKKTIEHLAQKEQADVAQVAFELKQEEENQEANRRRRRLARMRGSVDEVDAGKSSTDGGGDSKSKPNTEQDEYLFSFPRFGVSPGPSPRSTPSHTPEEMSETEDLDLEEDVLQDETSLVKMTTIQVAKPDEDQDDEISKFLAAEKEKEKEAEEGKQTSPRPKRKFGFSTITVDAKSLMKEGKKTAVSAVNRKPGSEVTSPRKATDSDSDTGEENKKSKRSERGSKKMGKTSQRKTLRSRKPEKEIPSTLEPPPTQMQTLEQKESMRSGHMNEEFNSMAAASNEDTDFIDGERPKAGAKRRPASTAQKTANFDADSQSKKETTGSQDIPIGTLDGRDGKVQTAQNLTEQIVKAETPEAKAVSPKPSELLTITPKPGSAKSRLSSAKNSSGVGGDVEDIQSFVSSEKDQGQSLVSANVIGERSVADARSDVGTRSGVAESFDRDGRKSALSTEGSEDSKTAFRLSLLTKEPCVEETVSEEGPADSATPLLTPDPRPSGTPDASTRDRTTPTSIETPELSGYARPSSQILSDAAFASPRDSEALREGVESVSEIRSAVPDYPDGVGTPDSAWMDQDIISVSRQHVRSADQHVTSSDLDDTSEFHGAQSGLGLMSQDGRQTALGDVTPEVKVIRSRPNTSVEDRALQKPELQSALTFFKQRPHTAQVRFRTEDLQSAFDTSLVRYKKLSRNPMTSDTLYRNSDQAFSEDWHERQVERHMLIRMQKELRSQNAERRRLAMQAQRQDLLQRRLHAQETQLFHRRAHPHSSAPPPPTTPTVPARASTVHGSRPSAMTGPAPSPVATRPHTAAGPGIHRHQHQQSHFYQQQQEQQQQQHHRPSQYSGESIARQLEAEAGRRLKAELSHEKPFRFKLRGTEADSCAPAVIDLGETIDPWLLDPRNPQAVRPKSSKSIPSKCHRYVLVTKPKAHLQIPLPSPLEEQLLATRFPQQGEKVFRQYEGLLFRPQRRPEYGINYSPFEHQLYG